MCIGPLYITLNSCLLFAVHVGTIADFRDWKSGISPLTNNFDKYD